MVKEEFVGTRLIMKTTLRSTSAIVSVEDFARKISRHCDELKGKDLTSSQVIRSLDGILDTIDKLHETYKGISKIRTEATILHNKLYGDKK